MNPPDYKKSSLLIFDQNCGSLFSDWTLPQALISLDIFVIRRVHLWFDINFSSFGQISFFGLFKWFSKISKWREYKVTGPIWLKLFFWSLLIHIQLVLSAKVDHPNIHTSLFGHSISIVGQLLHDLAVNLVPKNFL